jgi:hypothetical protein
MGADVANLLAACDVRACSVKRVGAAIGKGATVVAQIHTTQLRHRMLPRGKEQAADERQPCVWR